MAQHTFVEMVDDIDGTTLRGGEGETVRFGLDGVSLEIDLGRKNADRLRSVLAPYIESGRRAGRRGAPDPTTAPETAVDPRTVRRWAAANSIELSPRGRIPTSVIERFRAAGN